LWHSFDGLPTLLCYHVACSETITGRQFETELWNGETKCQRVLVQAMPKSTVKSIEIHALQWQYLALAQQLLKAIALVFISLRAFKYVCTAMSYSLIV
jgi:hypothetical protein